jgi:hypothetical protein
MRGSAGRVRSAVVGLAFIVCVALTAPSLAADESAVRFAVPRPFRVGGHGFEAGVIALHSVSSFTPTTSILEVWVNGECLGMMTAQRITSEAAPDESEALFSMADDGRLEMVGFRVTGRPTGTTYRFR